MPIYKLTQAPAVATASRSSIGDNPAGSQHQQIAFAELPESERYGAAKTTQLADTQYEQNGGGGDRMSESATDFIEREIREQRQREKELATLHSLVQSGAALQTSTSSSISPGDADDTQPSHVVVTASAALKSFHVPEEDAHPPSLHRHQDDRKNDYVDSGNDGKRHLAAAADYDQDDDDLGLGGQQFAHPGESLIVKELLEQQRREDELRQHWMAMGFELTEDHRADDDDDEESFKMEADRHPPAPPPQQQQQREDRRDEVRRRTAVSAAAGSSPTPAELEKLRPHAAASAAAPVATAAAAAAAAKDDDRPVDKQVRPQQSAAEPVASITGGGRKDEVRRESETESRRQQPAAAEAASASLVITVPSPPATAAQNAARTSTTTEPETPRKKLLMPLESAAADDDDEASAKVYLRPQAERAMEREMRAAREREIELREARGIPATTHEEARRSTSIEIEVIKPRLSVTSDAADGVGGGGLGIKQLQAADGGDQLSPDYRDFTKRFAESRLKVELQRERERELDLRRSGVIQSISEERAGEPVKFVEVFASPEDRAAKMEEARMTWRHRRSADPDLAPSHQQKQLSAADAASAGSHGPGPVVPATAPVSSLHATATDASPFAGYRRPLPPVFRTYRYPYNAVESTSALTADTLMTTTEHHGRRSFIETEVEEFHKRENELRLLRESLMRERAAKQAADESSKDRHDNDDRDRHHDDKDQRQKPAAAVQSHVVTVSAAAAERPEVDKRSSLPADMTSSSAARRRLGLIDEWEKMNHA